MRIVAIGECNQIGEFNTCNQIGEFNTNRGVQYTTLF